MKRLLMALIAGVLFGTGLALSGMTDPRLVLAFLDVAGDFDPRLGFVLAGAVMTTLIGFRWVLARPTPLFSDEFKLPSGNRPDAPLIVGAALFGIGWGIAGYCPGPALVGMAGGIGTAIKFIPAMLAGSLLHAVLMRRRL